MDPDGVYHQISEADGYITVAANTADRQPEQAAIYAQIGLARAIAGLATAVTYAAEQRGSAE